MPSLTKIQTGFLEPQGAFELTPGTASSPGLFFSGNTSTGMFSPSAGVLGFSTGSTQQALTILANGNVGIGTDNPTAGYLLDVRGRGKFTGSTGYVLDLLGVGNATAQIYVDTLKTAFRSDSAIQFFPSNTHQVTISSTGNVGIGTNNPSWKTEILSGSSGVRTTLLTLRSNSADSSTGTILRFVNSTSSTTTFGVASITALRTDFATGYTDFVFENSIGDSLSETLRIKANGNVGIGTDNPDSYNSAARNLVIEGGTQTGLTIATNSLTGNSRIYFADSTGGSGDRAGQINYQHSDDVMFFATAAGERLRITSSGAIGIGSDFTAIETAGGGGITIDSGVGGGQIGVFLKSTGYTGNQTKLWQDSANAVSYLESTERPLWIKAGDGAGDYLRMDVGGSERLLINSDGNVGIGTNNPTAKLDVRGSIVVDYDLVGISSVFKTFSANHSASNRGAKMRFGLNDGGFGGIEVENVVGSNSSFNSQTVHIINHNGGVVGDIKSLTVRYDGNVGIGVTNPSHPLTVSRDVGAGGYLASFNNLNTTYSQSISLYLDSAKDVTWSGGSGNGGLLWNFGTRGYVWKVNNSERLRIDSSGNLILDAGGEGQDIQIISHSAASGHGQIYVRGNASNETSSLHLNHFGHADYWISAGRTGNGLLSITRTNGGTDGIIINSSGNVGIGTNNPTDKLHVYLTSNRYTKYTSSGNLELFGPETGNDGQYVRIGSSYNQLGLYASSTMHFNADGPGGFIFGQSGTEKVRIASNGNIGINTTSTANPVNVYSSTVGDYNSNVEVNEGAAYDCKVRISAGSDSNRKTHAYHELIARETALSGHGRHAYIGAESGGNTYDTKIVFKARIGADYQYRSLTDLVTIHGNGNVGIGTNSPAAKLDVRSGGIIAGKSSSSLAVMTGISTGGSAPVVYDTGISINQGGAGGAMLLLASVNSSNGTATNSAVYLIRFYYDGNNTPTKHYIGGSSDFVSVSKSGSNTLILTSSNGGNVSYSWFGNKGAQFI